MQTDDHDNVEESRKELKELASTAGAVTGKNHSES